MPLRLFFATVLSLTLSSTGLAGSVIEFETTEFVTTPPGSGMVKISSQGGMTRLDVSSSSAGAAATIIYDGNADQMTVFDPEQQKYYVMTRAEMEAMAVQVSEAMQQMEAALAAMPPEQRKMAEDMMKSRMPAAVQAGSAPSTVARADGTDTVAGYDCDNYVVTSDGRKIREMCVTEWDDIEGARESAEALMDFADFFSSMREAMGSVVGGMSVQDMFGHLREIGGYPILSREFNEAGELISESRITAVRNEGVDAEVFVPPPGYQQQAIF